MSTTRSRPIVALSLLIGIFALLLGARPARAQNPEAVMEERRRARAPVGVELISGFGDRVRVDQWNPYVVELENRTGDRLEFDLRVEGGQRLTARLPVRNPAGHRGEVIVRQRYGKWNIESQHLRFKHKEMRERMVVGVAEPPPDSEPAAHAHAATQVAQRPPEAGRRRQDTARRLFAE